MYIWFDVIDKHHHEINDQTLFNFHWPELLIFYKQFSLFDWLIDT